MQKMLDSGEDCSEEKFLKGVREWRGRFSEFVEKGVEEVGENNGVAPKRAPLRPSTFASAPTGALTNDVQAWKQAVSQLKSKVETSHSNLINLELLSTFGQTSWLRHNKELTSLNINTSNHLNSLRLEVDSINSTRKNEQEAASARHGVLERKWYDLVGRNESLKRALEEKERESGKRSKIE
ncbi:hypothetical protein TL16_g10265 [Triparma laevis f. inornata]|uniref:Uncharacterized protein n=2 Tax=Triparma laevis TaxID=1534972 RepID=A0A9W6Z8M2_9STRA|nr:hypothetical protein TrLO_g6151 [Triparma laevis f. longispina]GMH85548.1 hypothetical protein TL16_g10265 [Triparma laevis f. inornata]